MGVAVSPETIAPGFFPRRLRRLLADAALQKNRSLRSSAPLRPCGFERVGRAQNGPPSQGMVPGESNTER
jgi:hypothetical protein